MLTRLLSAAALILSSGFTAALLLIHAQPHDDDPLRAFLADETGFMGMQPGVTTRNQALALLQAHPWVSEISTTDPYVLWVWSGAQPAFIAAETPGQVVIDNRHLVGEIHIDTHVTLSQLWLALGLPVSGYTAYQPNGRLMHHVDYASSGFSASLWIDCPAQLSDFWRAEVKFYWGDNWRSTLVNANYRQNWRQRATC